MAQMPEQTNPFKRLHDSFSIIIEQAREQGAPPNRLAQAVWLNALQTDESGLYNKQFELLLVVNSCEQLITRTFELNRERYLARMNKVREGILCIGSKTWEEFRRTINDDFMDVLEVTSDNISLSGGEEVITEEELASLQSDIEDIINKVVDSGLEDELKRVLFDGLESVRSALMNYQMFGAEGIRQSLDRNFALPFRYSDQFIRASGNEEGKKIVSDFFDFLKRVNTAVSTMLKICQIAGPAIDRMLESGN